MKRKFSIYLADLVHNYLEGGTHMFPLNIGFISAYAKKIFGADLEIELFKYPNDLTARIKENPPDLLGLSNYAWSSDLNGQIANFAKNVSKDIIVTFGGPDIDHTVLGYATFSRIRPQVDFYIINEGEVGFANLLRLILGSDKRLSEKKKMRIAGVVSFNGEKPLIGEKLNRIEKLDEIPSPYLTGMLDKFFNLDLIPVIETNRGCPFRCTYCVQGLSSQNLVKYFALERVSEELNYISERVHKTNILCLADANFGIADRDIEIAKHIRYLQDNKSYPRRCIINWFKTDKSIKLAELIGEAALMISSLQSMDSQVLKNIKRNNISQPHFKEIVDYVNSKGGISGTEIILGLPGETKESHLNNLRKLFDWNVSYIICYNLRLTEGSELNLPEQREKFNLKTKFRLLDTSSGIYDYNIISFECEEGVRATRTMSEEEILFFRPLHWLIQFCWNYRCYFELLKYIKNQNVNPVEFFLALTSNIEKAPPSVQKIFSEFNREAKEEWFLSPEDLKKYYSKPENLTALKNGAFGKMNGKYIWRVILECKDDFDSYIKQTAKKLLPNHEYAIESLACFSAESLLDFNNIDKWDCSKEIKFDYDILGWKEDKYEGAPEQKENLYLFHLPHDQKEALNILFKQYKHPNKNVTLRKVSEHMRITDLFYKIKKA